MRTIKVLGNKNKICNEITTNVSYSDLNEDFSIRIVFSGNGQYRIGNKILVVYPGNFVTINEGTHFNKDVYSDVPANIFTIFYSSSYLHEFHRNCTKSESNLLDDPFGNKQNAKPSIMETIYPLVGDMRFNLLHLKDHYDSGHHNEMLLDEYLYYGLLNFYNLYQEEILLKRDRLSARNNKTRHELFKRLSVAKDFMLSNYNQSITVREVSRHACLSEIHFFRTFKQIFDCSPHQYLMRLRLNNARHMLKSTAYTVSEIVNLVGFDNTSSFIRLFKDRFGYTPGSYRNQIFA